MSDELGHPGQPADQGGNPRAAGYCYRCGSLLDQSPDWCGTCGASQTAVCRRCGAVFPKASGRCPRCGTRRVRRRRSRSILRRLFKERLPAWMERNRTTLLYMIAGGAVGVVLGIVLKALAETSGTPSSGEHPPDSLMFWIQPFISAGRTIARAVQGFFTRTWDALVYFVLMHLKATILTVVGALVGLVLGIRAERKRRKRQARRMKTRPRAGARRDAEP